MIDKIEDNELDQEAEAIRTTAFFEAELPDLPLTRLRDRTFEILALALARAQAKRDPARFDTASLLREGADKGRDVLLLKEEHTVGVLQCKRYSNVIGLPLIFRELMRFALLAVREPRLVPQPDGFIYEFWTAGEITSEAQQFFDSPRSWIDGNRNLLLQAAQKARINVVALKTENEGTAAGENEAAVDLVRQFELATVGPVDIRMRLADEDVIRRRFFRGPDDRPHPARAGDIEGLMDAIRCQEAGASVTKAGRYVRRASLDREFEAFMISPGRIFVVVGHSGGGKSTWASRIRSIPPKAVRVDIVRGEDIHPSDHHVADTIARTLQRRPLGGIASTDLVQAVFDWLADASRLIVIDGIDRAPRSAWPSLHDYLKRTFDTTTHSSSRFVVTSRPTAWALIGPEIVFDTTDVHRPESSSPHDAFPAFDLGALSREEANEIYRTYGLVPPKASSRFFRSPGLIAREAAVRASDDSRLGTRLAVLSDSVGVLERRLRRDHEIGPLQFARLLELLGDGLIEVGDGLLDAEVLRRRHPESVAALDSMTDAELVVIDGRSIRIEPDDLVEYLMSLRLDVKLARALLDKHGGDLLVGAAALCVARLEEAGEDRVREAIDVLRENADFDHPALAAAARAVTELRGRVLVREMLDAMLRDWRHMNLLLDASPLVWLIGEVNLSPVERLEAAMVLADREDTWDWRGKYFQNPALVADRDVTGFGRAAASAIAEDSEGTLTFLLGLVDKAEASEGGFDTYESVVSGLIYLAVDGAPSTAARAAWDARGTIKKWLLDRVRDRQPEAVALLLESLAGHQPDRDAAIDCLWQMTLNPPVEKSEDSRFRTAIASAATAYLPYTVAEPQIVRLLVAKLLARFDSNDEARLSALWGHVDDEIFWYAVKARSSNRLELLTERMFEGNPDGREFLLQSLPVGLFVLEDWAGIADLLERAADNGLGAAAALTLETMLHQAAAQNELGRLMPLARKFASSEISSMRSPMIYFAGGYALLKEPTAATERAELLGLLALHEDGLTLAPLVWKVVASANLHSSSIYNLRVLCGKFGGATINALIANYRLLEPVGFGALQDRWRSLPVEDHTSFEVLGTTLRQ